MSIITKPSGLIKSSKYSDSPAWIRVHTSRSFAGGWDWHRCDVRRVVYLDRTGTRYIRYRGEWYPVRLFTWGYYILIDRPEMLIGLYCRLTVRALVLPAGLGVDGVTYSIEAGRNILVLTAHGQICKLRPEGGFIGPPIERAPDGDWEVDYHHARTRYSGLALALIDVREHILDYH